MSNEKSICGNWKMSNEKSICGNWKMISEKQMNDRESPDFVPDFELGDIGAIDWTTVMFTEQEIERAKRYWRAVAPQRYKYLLDARVEGEASSDTESEI